MLRRLILVSVVLLLLCGSVSAQEIYLSPVLGNGGDGPDNRFHSYCTDIPGASSIDLRTDKTKSTGFFLCQSSTLPVGSGIVSLTNTRTGKFSGLVKAALASSFGRAVAATDVTELVKELLIDTGRIVPGKDGKLKIYLGGPDPLYSRTSWAPFEDHGYLADAWNALQPAVAWATVLATETFPTNGDLNGSTQVHNWTETNGTGWTVTGNQAVGTTASSDARANTDMATDANEVGATIVNIVQGTSTSIECGPITSKDATNTRTWYGMFAELTTAGDTNHWYILERSAGVASQIGTTNNTDWVANDVSKIRRDGSTFTGYVNNTIYVGPVTDPSPVGTGNLRGGINVNGNNSGFSCTLDNWFGQDVTAAAFGPLRRRF